MMTVLPSCRFFRLHENVFILFVSSASMNLFAIARLTCDDKTCFWNPPPHTFIICFNYYDDGGDVLLSALLLLLLLLCCSNVVQKSVNITLPLYIKS